MSNLMLQGTLVRWVQYIVKGISKKKKKKNKNDSSFLII